MTALTTAVRSGGFDWTGKFTTVDLIEATTNAPLAREPAGVYQHDEGRPMLGRKLKGKSQRELHALGLAVEPDEQPPETPALGGTT